MTEYVAWQEDLENCNEQLRAKNPAYYDRLNEEVDNIHAQEVIDSRTRELQEILFQSKEEHQLKQSELMELVKVLDGNESQCKCYDDMCLLILEDIFKREKTLFYLFHTVVSYIQGEVYS